MNQWLVSVVGSSNNDCMTRLLWESNPPPLSTQLVKKARGVSCLTSLQQRENTARSAKIEVNGIVMEEKELFYV